MCMITAPSILLIPRSEAITAFKYVRVKGDNRLYGPYENVRYPLPGHTARAYVKPKDPDEKPKGTGFHAFLRPHDAFLYICHSGHSTKFSNRGMAVVRVRLWGRVAAQIVLMYCATHGCPVTLKNPRKLLSVVAGQHMEVLDTIASFPANTPNEKLFKWLNKNLTKYAP